MNNPPNFIVNCNGVKELSEIVQRLAFSHDLEWLCGSKTLKNDYLIYIFFIRKADNSKCRGWTKNTLYHTGCDPTAVYADLPMFNAATQMGEIIELLNKKVEVDRLIINNLEVRYNKGDQCFNYGNTSVGIGILKAVVTANNNTVGDKLRCICFPSVNIFVNDMEKILNYIDKINNTHDNEIVYEKG